MSRISRLVVLVTGLLAAMTTTAGAVTWTNDGSTAFTATGGIGTLASTGVTIACGGSDASGTAPASSAAATYLISGTIGFTSCLAAGSPATIDCGYTFTATAVAQPTVSGSADVTCGLYISGTKLCHIENATSATYTNETGTFQVATSTALRVTGASCPVGANDLGHLTALDFRVSSATPPTVTRSGGGGGTTWTNDGSTAFTATGGIGTLTSTGVTIACGGSDASGTAPGDATASTYSISGTIGFTSCTAAGSPATIDCGYTFTATAVAQPTVTGSADVTCSLYISGTKLCHIEGATPTTYTNETGTFQVATSTALRVTGASCPVGANDLGHLTTLDFRVSSATPPTITRVA